VLVEFSAFCAHLDSECIHLDENPFSRGEKEASTPCSTSWRGKQRPTQHFSTADAESSHLPFICRSSFGAASDSSRACGDPAAGGLQSGKSGMAAALRQDGGGTGSVSELPFHRLHPPLEKQSAMSWVGIHSPEIRVHYALLHCISTHLQTAAFLPFLFRFTRNNPRCCDTLHLTSKPGFFCCFPLMWRCTSALRRLCQFLHDLSAG